MEKMGAERMLEELSRFRPDSRQSIQWGWCLHKWQSNKILAASERACKAVPGLTVTVIPEPISWYPKVTDFNGDPILVGPWRRQWYRLFWSGYQCQIRGEARQIQDYLRLLKDMLDVD